MNDPIWQPPQSDPPAAPKRRSWGLYAVLAVVAVLIIVVFAMLAGGRGDSQSMMQPDDAQARNAAIGALLSQIGDETGGAIAADDPNETFNWDGHSVHFKLRISNCRNVDGYATTPQLPSDTSQVALHILVPGGNSDGSNADLPLTISGLQHLKATLQHSDLMQCTAGDKRLAP